MDSARDNLGYKGKTFVRFGTVIKQSLWYHIFRTAQQTKPHFLRFKTVNHKIAEVYVDESQKQLLSALVGYLASLDLRPKDVRIAKQKVRDQLGIRETE